jgi:hypothetical protein
MRCQPDYLQSVSAASATDAWAVGEDSLRLNANTEISGTLIEHWNGKTWSTAASPGRGQLTAVSAATATGAWAAGSYCVSACGLDAEVDHTLIEHGNGRT